jgi:hypothetical protein
LSHWAEETHRDDGQWATLLTAGHVEVREDHLHGADEIRVGMGNVVEEWSGMARG